MIVSMRWILLVLALGVAGLARPAPAAPAPPPGHSSQTHPAEEATGLARMRELLAELRIQNHGMPDRWQQEWLKAMQAVYGNAEPRPGAEALLLDFLQSDAPESARQVAARELGLIATERSTPALLRMLRDGASADLASSVLEHSGLGSAAEIREAFTHAPVGARAHVVELLADRPDEASLPLLCELAQSGDGPEADAALRALGALGSPAAAACLADLASDSAGGTAWKVREAKLHCAENLERSGYHTEADALYQELLDKGPGLTVGAAALSGLFHLSADPVAFITRTILASDPGLRRAGIRLLLAMPDGETPGGELLALEGLSAADTTQLLKICARRGDPTSRAAAVYHLQSGVPALRAAALEVLAVAGRPDDVEGVAERAVSGTPAERRLAQAALHRMPGKDVDQRIVSLLETAAPPLQVVLIEAMAARGVSGADNTLLQLARAEEAQTRIAAVRALGRTSPPATIPAIVRLAEASDDPATQREIQIAIELVALRQPDPAECVDVIREQMAGVQDERVRARLMAILEHLESKPAPATSP